MRKCGNCIIALGMMLAIIAYVDSSNYRIDSTSTDTMTSIQSDVASGEEAINTVQILTKENASEPSSMSMTAIEDDEVAQAAGLRTEEYSYQVLTAEGQTVYKEIYQILKKVGQEVQVSTLDTELLNKVFQCVMNDHPEIFYTKGYDATQYMIQNKTNRIIFQPIYTMSLEEIKRNQKCIKDYVDKCMDSLPKQADDYEKIRYFYEYIILNTEYNTNSKNSQNICSVMIDKKSVCQGYAKAMQYLCQQAGIEAVLVTGYANGVGHAWNLVYADETPYYVDVTWGDASYIITGESDFNGVVPPITYDYLMVTTDMLSKTHRIDNVVALPQCNSTALNYYVKENLFFNAYDENRIETVFSQALNEGEKYITLKCAGDEIYRQMKEQMIDEQKVFQFLPTENRTIAFSENPVQYTLSFMLE